MGVSVRVIAPYVTLRVKALTGTDVVQGYYAPAVIDAEEGEVLDRHLASGMVEKVEADKSATDPAEPETPVFERPAGNASQEAWATYALESGQASEDEVKGLSRDDLRELYG